MPTSSGYLLPALAPSRDLAGLLRDYEFVRDGRLGEGAFGAVLQVRHRVSQEARACKSLQLDASSSSQVQMEVSLLSALDHPSILRLYETFYDANAAFLVTELCAGGALSDRLRHHAGTPMPEPQALVYLEQILGALRYCHRRQVLHRDLKPENVLFLTYDPGSPLKLIDFGLATSLQTLCRSARPELVPRGGVLGQLARLGLVSEHAAVDAMQRAGTPHYMAPEVYEGHYAMSADLWSAGVLAVQLLLAVHPFYEPGLGLGEVRRRILESDARTLRELLERGAPGHGSGAARALPGPLPAARDLCLLLLRRDPEERPSAAEALQQRCFLELPRPLEDCLDARAALEGLRGFARSGQLRRAALLLLAGQLPEQAARPLRSLFARLDAESAGLLGPELRGLDPEELEEWRHLLRSTAPAGLGYGPFLASMLRHVRLGEAQLRSAFGRLDVLGQGRLTPESLRQTLQRPDAALQELGGGLDFHGFCRLVTGAGRVVS